jgi:hypothetical protein
MGGRGEEPVVIRTSGGKKEEEDIGELNLWLFFN